MLILRSSSYPIVIQEGLLQDSAQLTAHLASLGSRYAIIADEPVANLQGKGLAERLTTAGLETHLFSFPAGESHKTRATKEELENQLFSRGLGKDTCVIALGGGVATDLGGFLAATYCRGVPLVMIPTSLLGMIDASIGGKVGVDVPYGKNLIGCIYQPRAVLIDPTALRSLPSLEIANGIMEMIKHGLVADANHFSYLEEHRDQLLALHMPTMTQAIWDSCRIKIEIIEEDKTETGKRHLLNCGHTVAHALEKVTHYAIPHGQAVALGLLAESDMACQMGYLDKDSLSRIQKLISAYAPSFTSSNPPPLQEMLDAMVLDKKSLKGRPRFVLLQKIGLPLSCGGAYCDHVPEDVIKSALLESRC